MDTLVSKMQSSAKPQRLTRYREAIATLSGGKDISEELGRPYGQRTSNWAELLQPALLNVAFLGSMLCIALCRDNRGECDIPGVRTSVSDHTVRVRGTWGTLCSVPHMSFLHLYT
jgi:hypothetical protein